MSSEVLAERAIALAAMLASPPRDVPGLRNALGLVGELRRLIDGVGVDLAGELSALVEREPERLRDFGERSAAAVVQVQAGVDGSEAGAWCRVGSALRARVNLQGEVLPGRHEVLAAALDAGRVRVGGAERVLAVIDEIAPFATLDQCEALETFLVGAAPELTDRQFARLCRTAVSRFEPDQAEAREELLRARSGLVVRRTPDGLVRWIVTMHPEAAGFATAALDARTAPRRQPVFVDAEVPLPVEEDRRPLAHRRLDAFVALCRESLAHDDGQVAGSPVTMVVTTTLDALRAGLGEARISGVEEPISAATARRLAADAGIIPAVLGGASERLDLGREVRLATAGQRRALEVRDQGCCWGTCSAPPGWCEVAHIVPWFEGGGTDLDNLMLLCAFHHRVFDLGGWAFEQRDGKRYFIPPPWVDAARTPQRAGPLPVLEVV